MDQTPLPFELPEETIFFHFRKERTASEKHLVTFHAHDADGGSGATALDIVIDRAVFDIDFRSAFKVFASFDQQRVSGSEFGNAVLNGAERPFKGFTVVFIIAPGGNIKSPGRFQHGTCTVICNVDRCKYEAAPERCDDQYAFHKTAPLPLAGEPGFRR